MEDTHVITKATQGKPLKCSRHGEIDIADMTPDMVCTCEMCDQRFWPQFFGVGVQIFKDLSEKTGSLYINEEDDGVLGIGGDGILCGGLLQVSSISSSGKEEVSTSS